MLPLVPRTSVDGSYTLSDIGVTKYDPHDMRRKSKIPQQRRYCSTEIMSVPSRSTGEPMQPLCFSIPVTQNTTTL